MSDDEKLYTIQELLDIANEREAWAIAASEKDLHGSATEWRMTARLARKLVACMEREKNDGAA